MTDFLKKSAPAGGDPDHVNPDEGDETGGEGGASSSGGFDHVELAPEGDYEVVVLSAVYGTSKSSGAQQWTLGLACPELPGANAKYYLTNTPGGKWRLDKDLKTLGLGVPEKGGPQVVYKDTDFIGKKIMAKGKHDFYQGRKNFKFTEIWPTAEGPGARAFAQE